MKKIKLMIIIISLLIPIAGYIYVWHRSPTNERLKYLENGASWSAQEIDFMFIITDEGISGQYVKDNKVYTLIVGFSTGYGKWTPVFFYYKDSHDVLIPVFNGTAVIDEKYIVVDINENDFLPSNVKKITFARK